MIPILLDEIRIRWRDHKSALWWLFLLYRRPTKFKDAVIEVLRRQKIWTLILFFLHAIPYILCLCLFGRFMAFASVNSPIEQSLIGTFNTLSYHGLQVAYRIVEGISVGVTVGIAFGVLFGIGKGVVVGIALGIALGSALGIVFETAQGIAFGIAFGVVFSIVFEISFWIASGIAFGMALGVSLGIVLAIALDITIKIPADLTIGIALVIAISVAKAIKGGIPRGLVLGIIIGTAGGAVFGIAEGIEFGIAFLIFVLRLYYYSFHPLYFLPEVRGQWYPYHPVAWDNICAIAFPKLERLLVAYAEQKPREGMEEIERLITTYPSQRSRALRAKVELLARKAAQVEDLANLDEIVAQLPVGDKGFLGEIPRLQEWINEICRRQAHLNTISRPIFREPVAQTLCKEIENFQHRIRGLQEPLATEFRAAAARWLKIAQRELEEAKSVFLKEPTPQVFHAGHPVDRAQEAFIPRHSVLEELDKQIMLNSGCPGLVLYGRRRMGKSTILRNISGFLPVNVLPVNISMQDPRAFTSISSFMQLLAHAVQKVLLDEKASDKMPADLSSFFQLLSQCNSQLEQEGKRLLLAIDEYENIDMKIGERVFKDDLLAMLRESIQSHRFLTWIFSGSHTITELKNAPWTSYLVSALTLEVPMFSPAETSLLLTAPLQHSEFWSKDDPDRPHFAPDFWGERGIERIHHEAGGWPHLVQLIAETIVDLINDETKHQVDAELFERSLNKAIVSGHNVLYQLMKGESTLPGEWEYLAAFRKRETQPPPEDEAIYTSLYRRLLVEEENGLWRLRVPLMARWLKERG